MRNRPNAERRRLATYARRREVKAGATPTLTDLRLTQPMKRVIRNLRNGDPADRGLHRSRFSGHVFVLQALVVRKLVTWDLQLTDFGRTVADEIGLRRRDLAGQGKLFQEA